MSENKENKHDFKCNTCQSKCVTCQYYEKKNDFCKEKEIENCSKTMLTEFSQCDSYLIRENLIMF